MQTFKDLTFKKRVEHIFYYYKWHMLAAVMMLVFMTNLIVTISQKDKNTPLLTISIQGNPQNYDQITAWEEEITSKIAAPDTEQKVRVDYYPIRLENEDQISAAHTQKFAVLLAAGDLDVVCLDEELFLAQAAKGYYHPLDQLPELSGVLDKIETRAVKSKTDDDSSEHIYGIWAKDLEALEQLGENTENKVIGIIRNSKRLSYSIDFIKLILQE